MFTVKTAAQLEEMTIAEKDTYLQQKSLHDEKVMSDSIAKAVDEKTEAIKSELASDYEAKLNEEVAKAQKENEEKIKGFTDTLKQQGLEISEIKKRKQEVSQNVNLFISEFEKELTRVREANKGGIVSNVLNGGTAEVNIELKANVLLSSHSNNPAGTTQPGVVELARFPNSLDGLFRIVQLPEGDNNGKVYVVEEDSLVVASNIAAVGEGVAVPESAFALITSEYELKEFGHSIPISEKAMRYNPLLIVTLEGFLWTAAAEELNREILLGDPLTNSDELEGVYTIATGNPYPLGPGLNPFFEQVQNPNIRDIIIQAADYAHKFFKHNNKVVNINYCVMNPKEEAKILLLKDANDKLLFPDYNGFIGKIEIRTDDRMAEDELIVGDRNATTYHSGYGTKMTFERVNNQFLERKITARVVKENLLVTPNERKSSLVHVVSIAAAISDSKKP